LPRCGLRGNSPAGARISGPLLPGGFLLHRQQADADAVCAAFF